MTTQAFIVAAIDPTALAVAALVGGFAVGLFYSWGLTAIAVTFGLAVAGAVLGRQVDSVTSEEQGGPLGSLLLLVFAFVCAGAGSEVGSWLKDRST